MSMYLKLGYIEGSCSEKDYQGYIKLNTIKFGLSRNLQMAVGDITDRELSGHPKIYQLFITKDIDLSSIYLAQEVCRGKACGDAEIYFTHNKGNYFKLKLDNVIVGGYDIEGIDEEKPLEEIVLSFTKFEMVYMPSNEKSKVGSPLPMSYDLKSGTLG